MKDVLADVDRWTAAGDRVALATVVGVKKSAPRPTGAKLAVSAAGELSGAVSGGCVEGAVVEAAEAVLVRERGITGWFGITPRVRQEIDYEGRLWFDQPVSCELVLERLGTSSATFSFEVRGEDFDGHPGGRAASGRLVVVHAPDPAGRSAPWPAAWRAALGG